MDLLALANCGFLLEPERPEQDVGCRSPEVYFRRCPEFIRLCVSPVRFQLLGQRRIWCVSPSFFLFPSCVPPGKGKKNLTRKPDSVCEFRGRCRFASVCESPARGEVEYVLLRKGPPDVVRKLPVSAPLVMTKVLGTHSPCGGTLPHYWTAQRERGARRKV